MKKTITLTKNGQNIEVLNPLYKPLDRLYMHTLDNLPAIFDGDQICHSYPKIKLSEMATSLKQIRREQVKHEMFRQNAFNDTSFQAMGHIVINLK